MSLADASSRERRRWTGRAALAGLVCLPIWACSLERSGHGPGAQPAAAGPSALDAGPSAAQGGGGGHAGTGGSAASGGAATPAGGSGGDASRSAGPDLDGGWLADAGDAASLGYRPYAVGAPCRTDTQCAADGVARICFTENYFQPLLTLPNGYCGKLCDLSLSMPCEQGAACITFPTFPPILACMRACTSDGDCRVQDGYSCNKPFTSTKSVCSLRN